MCVILFITGIATLIYGFFEEPDDRKVYYAATSVVLLIAVFYPIYRLKVISNEQSN